MGQPRTCEYSSEILVAIDKSRSEFGCPCCASAPRTVFDIETFCPRILQTDYSSIWRALHSDDAIIVARSGVAGLFGQLASLARSTFESLTGRESPCNAVHGVDSG